MIAETILEQLRQIDLMAVWSWGSTNFTNYNDRGLRFKVNGAKCGRALVLITLNGADLYDIKIYRVYKGEDKVIAQFEDVYVFDLVNVIDEVVEG